MYVTVKLHLYYICMTFIKHLQVLQYINIDCIEHKGCMSKFNTFEKNEFLTSNAREKYRIVTESYFLYVIVYFFQWVIM